MNIENILHFFPSLTSLDIWCGKIFNLNRFENYFTLYGGLLTKLNISYISSLTSNSIETILKACSNLIEFVARGISFSDSNVEDLYFVPKLIVLDLLCNNQLSFSCRILSYLTNLEVLNISKIKTIENRELFSFSSNLKSLLLSNAPIFLGL